MYILIYNKQEGAGVVQQEGARSSSSRGSGSIPGDVKSNLNARRSCEAGAFHTLSSSKECRELTVISGFIGSNNYGRLC